MEGSGGAHIRLVDMNAATVEETWPLLLAAVEGAHFIAVDLELSGLGRHITKRTSEPDEKYKRLREVASSYSIISMGVACFQWQPVSPDIDAVPCKAEVFNILMLSQQPYTMDPDSGQFLLKHGFDFNKQLRHGLPYSPVAGGGSEESGTKKLVELFQRLLLSYAPLVLHNGWLDLLFLYHTCHAPLPMSRDMLVADLAEMFESGGVYDTKAIARYHHSEERSFLEYVFKKALVDNQWLELLIPDYPALPSIAMEMIELPRIPVIPPTELEAIQVCKNTARHGGCEVVGCEACHDVTIAVLQELHSRDVQRIKRKRKRERQKQTTPHTERQTPHTLVELFQQELASARTKHGSKKESEMQSEGDTMQSEGDTMKTSISCGHRAGFDAFMTGYTFACYALNACTHIMSSQPTSLTPDALTQALGQWRNCLSNRGSTPIKIATSQFSRPSEPHKTLWQTLQHKTSINND